MKFLQYWITRTSHPLRGIWYALKNDTAIQIEVGGGLLALAILHYFFGPFSDIGNLLLVFCFFLILITEFQNSAVETALDRIHPERHDEIGRSKDLAAASVMCAAVFSLVCAYFVITGRI